MQLLDLLCAMPAAERVQFTPGLSHCIVCAYCGKEFDVNDTVETGNTSVCFDCYDLVRRAA